MAVRTAPSAPRKTVSRRVASLPKARSTSPRDIPSPRLRLPRRLPRPFVPVVGAEALVTAIPELGDAPLEYIIKSLQSKPLQSGMLRGLASLVPKASLVVPVRDLTSHLPVAFTPNTNESTVRPTHVIAVHNGQQETDAMLYPCHSLPLLAHCAAISRLPETTSSNDKLPVVSLRLPNPESFHIIRDFIYTHSVPNLMAALLPIAPSLLPSSKIVGPANLARTIAASVAPTAVLEFARRIHGVWLNVCVLGLSDERMWNSLQLAWQITMGAMSMVAERSRR